MSLTNAGRAALAVVSFALWPAPALAQIYETVGTRAQGLGGAFVAVADDASATWWNPAGVATGPLFTTVVERSRTTEPAKAPPAGPVWRGDTTAFAIAFPALGLSYYRLRISEIAATTSTAAGGPGRQDIGVVGTGLRSVVTSQFGATVGQSFGRHLVLASTARLVRAGATTVGDAPAGASLDDAAALDVPLKTSGDLDLGIMVSLGRARMGASLKHVNEPALGDGPGRLVLKRQARAGMAFFVGKHAAISGLTMAADADVTRTATAFGEARHVAAGIEARLLTDSLAVRAGVSANTLGAFRTSTSAGLSLVLRRGFYIDGAVTIGSDRSRQGWSAGIRLTL